MTDTADVLFVNGAVGGPADPQPPGTAVAVQGERILAVGPEDRVRELRGSRTEVVDLRGATLLPGFQDAHVHPIAAGVEYAVRCNLRDSTSVSGYEDSTVAGYQDLVRAYADRHPYRPWILGGGWSLDVFPGGVATAAMLDAVVPDRPVYLPARDGHSAWVNSRALELAGVTAATPDPYDGRIERDADGNPSGLLSDGAMELVRRLVPLITEDELDEGLRYAQDHLQSLGITAWQDAQVLIAPGADGQSTLEAYRRAVENGTLTTRVIGGLWWDRSRGIEQVADIVAARDAYWSPLFQPRVVKIMLDGMIEFMTASMLKPYCGHPTVRPDSFISPDLMREIGIALGREGFSLHIHAVGDLAVRDALDAIAATQSADGNRGYRHQVAHLDIVEPADIARFGEIGALANVQMVWACHEPQLDEQKAPLLGDERFAWSFPFGDLVNAGARLAAGSDWPVSSANPMDAIHVAVNRTHPGLGGPAFLPEQAISLAEAVTSYTSGSAWANHLDDTGKIRTGYLADLVTLDRDLTTVRHEELSAVQVTSTYVGGSRVYEAS
ncbi:amidohydrolase [Nocardioides carbamazepini]|uniref:amidohydrolase n=1 Tax=Nocardioides carbamazepini TaxID=2854259 RepID=UPI00214A8998|nr:amidohydrolase [Nocardioides carbamazepini]MCR1786135.1 amidohydrolase [Nocardioides carbamazepini]